MAIKKTEIKKIVDSYKKNGYANIFIMGEVGSGRSIFGTQLIVLLCKELKINKNINMVYYNMKDFVNGVNKVKFLDVDLYTIDFLNLSFIRDNLTKNINIFDTTERMKIIEDFSLSHFIFEVIVERDGVFKRGRYKFEEKIGRFTDKEVFDMRSLRDMKKKEFEKNIMSKGIRDKLEYRDFTKRIRQERMLGNCVIPQLSDPEIRRERKKRMNKKKIVFRILLVLLIIVSLVSAFLVDRFGYSILVAPFIFVAVATSFLFSSSSEERLRGGGY